MDGWPLEKLLELRRREEDDRQRDLADARAATDRARAGAAAANDALVDARLRAAEAARRAEMRAGAGSATAGDLAAAARFRVRLFDEEELCLADVRAAEARVREAQRAEEGAREALVEAVKLRELMDKKEEEWRREQRRVAERKSQDR